LVGYNQEHKSALSVFPAWQVRRFSVQSLLFR